MKNFLSNKSLRMARLAITTIFTLMLGASIGQAVAPFNTPMIAIISLAFVGAGILVGKGYKFSERRRMAFACALIDDDITITCGALVGGVNPTFYLANKDDIASITLDATNPMIAEAVVMKTTKKFFTVSGQLRSLQPKWAAVKGDFLNQYEHEVGFMIFDIGPDTLEQVAKFKDGDFVAIVRNNYTGPTGSGAGNCKYDIYGAEGGLKLETNDRDPQDTSNLGAIKVLLKTQEYSRENKPPLRLYDTDSATTEGLVDDLLVAAP